MKEQMNIEQLTPDRFQVIYNNNLYYYVVLGDGVIPDYEGDKDIEVDKLARRNIKIWLFGKENMVERLKFVGRRRKRLESDELFG